MSRKILIRAYLRPATIDLPYLRDVEAVDLILTHAVKLIIFGKTSRIAVTLVVVVQTFAVFTDK